MLLARIGWGLLLALGLAVAARGDVPARADLLTPLCAAKPAERVAGVAGLLGAVAAGEDPGWGAEILAAVGAKRLICDGAPLVTGEGGVRDAATLAPSPRDPGKAQGVFVDLKLRAQLDMGIAILRLLADPGGPGTDAALAELQKRAKIVPAALVARAADLPGNARVAGALADIAAVAALADPARRLEAIARIGAAPSERNRTLLRDLAADPAVMADPAVAAAVNEATRNVEFWLRAGQGAAVVYSGLSYASILFMAAMGLAIIFGLMGVINLAQGELIMIGAYATWGVQQVLRLVWPGALDWYLLLAIPVAFAVTAAVGMAMELVVIRHLYRRPLMTLLATWAISLLLINLVRVGFGTQNLEFHVPGFLTGGVTLFADFIVTWNRLFAIGFAAVVLAGALAVFRWTRLGMYIRAVTENRDMAGCVGVSTRRVDLLAFGIGSGLAGLAGLALSPIYTVNPGMGASFIVDAFMIVVLGGVGSLVGTAVASLGIGMINVVVEPLYGAVAAKVFVLLVIILFIQVRPEGLFALRGRR